MIGDDINLAVGELRAQAESMMTAQVTIERPGSATFDPDTNQLVPSWTPVYEGPCRLYAPGRTGRPQMPAEGEQQVNTQRYFGSLPWSADRPQASDRVTATASDNPSQVGKTFTIESVIESNAAIAHRFVAIDDQG